MRITTLDVKVGFVAALLLTMLGACRSASSTPDPGTGAPAVGPAAPAPASETPTAPDPTPRFTRGAVAADSELASLAGVEIMKAGGNAVDAAIATALTLSVTRPYSCGIGGGGFMVVFDPGNEEMAALDFRETCPGGVGPEFYADQEPTASGYDPSRYGGRAVGIPGQIPGMIAAHERWGSLPMSRIVEPAARAAREGFPVDAHYLGAVRSVAEVRRKHPDLCPMSNWVWSNLCGEGDLEIGDLVVQPALASFLDRVGRTGLSAWDDVAPLVAGADRAADGRLTENDVRDYEVIWRTPLVIEDAMHGVDAILMPPPSSGGIAMAQVMGMVDRRREAFGDPAPGEIAHVELLAGAFRHAFADRARHLSDPDFSPVPVDALLAGDAIDATAASLSPGVVVPQDRCGVLPPAPATPLDDRGTSHFSVIDADGMTVACTQTINGSFGSLVAVPKIGVVLNNEMNDFTTIPGEANMFGLEQSRANLPEPGKRPLSSMSPTILLRDGRTVATAGASGGPRIITGTLQVLLRVLERGETAASAVAAPRIHAQWAPDVIRLEPGLESASRHLESMGHDVTETGGVGVVQVIVVHPDGYEPASDPRKGGRSAGW